MNPWPAEKQQLTDSYGRDGLVIIRGLYTSTEIAEIRTHLQRYIAEVVPTVPPMDVFFEDKERRDAIRMLPRMNEHDSFFDQLLRHSRMREIAESFWGCAACPRDAAFFNKPARIGAPTPPHQDGYYFHIQPCEALTFWLPLELVNEENGCVRYVLGSHRLGMRPHAQTNVLGFSQGITDFGTAADVQRQMSAEVDPGDVIVHDALTVHWAEANQSSRSRPALGFVYFSERAQIDTNARDRYHAALEAKLRSEAKID